MLLATANVFGAHIGWRAYAVFGIWALANAIVSPWAARPADRQLRLRRYALTLGMDVLMLGAAYLFLDGAQIIGAVFFAHQALVGSATLPRKWAIGMAALIIAVFSALVITSMLGLVAVPSPIDANPMTGNWAFAVASITSAVAMVVLVMHLQAQLVRSIRDVEERYVTLVDAAADMVMTFDATGHFLEVNPATLEQTGYTWNEIKALPNRTFFPQADWAVARDAFQRALAGQSFRLEIRIVRKDGSERWVQATTSPVMLDGERAVLVIARDMTDARRQSDELRERDELRKRIGDTERIESLGKLVSGVAHELNNPLAAILNFTEDLLADDRSPEERVALEVIQAQALRSRTIVRDLLTYARQGSARPLALADPVPILEAIARAMRPGLASQGVAFAVELNPSDAELMLDRAGFEQVVTNLITNAAHAAGAGGTVHLSSRWRREWFEVVVEDNGAGIDADAFPRIFEPFFTTKPTGQGVGLGLSVSMGIVKAHRGTLIAENRSLEVGGGARFMMRLPHVVSAMVTAADAPISERRLSPAKGGAPIPVPISGPRMMPPRNPTILIIDDEDAIRQGLKRYLTRRGWTVEESADGADALSKLLRPEALRIYDVILCDLKMAGVSGMDVYNRVRTTAPSIAKRFVLSTGDTTAPDVAGFLSQVDVPILEKPFEMATFEALADQVRAGAATDMASAARGPA